MRDGQARLAETKGARADPGRGIITSMETDQPRRSVLPWILGIILATAALYLGAYACLMTPAEYVEYSRSGVRVLKQREATYRDPRLAPIFTWAHYLDRATRPGYWNWMPTR